MVEKRRRPIKLRRPIDKGGRVKAAKRTYGFLVLGVLNAASAASSYSKSKPQ